MRGERVASATEDLTNVVGGAQPLQQPIHFDRRILSGGVPAVAGLRQQPAKVRI